MFVQHSQFQTVSVQTNQRLMQRVFSWMFVGLSMTAIIAFVLSMNPAVPAYLAANKLVFYGIIGFQLLTVFLLSMLIHRMPVFLGIAAFFFYAALNGVSFTLILAFFNLGTIATAFFVAAGMFGACAVIGYTTKMDLS